MIGHSDCMEKQHYARTENRNLCRRRLDHEGKEPLDIKDITKSNRSTANLMNQRKKKQGILEEYYFQNLFIKICMYANSDQSDRVRF